MIIINKVILLGRLVKDPDVRYAGQTTVARYTLAVDRKFKQEGQPTADFISCVAFGKGAEFTEKYLRKGSKIAVVGRIQTGSYEKDGQRVHTTDVVVEEQEFAESKSAADNSTSQEKKPTDNFMNIPDGDVSELPFN